MISRVVDIRWQVAGQVRLLAATALLLAAIGASAGEPAPAVTTTAAAAQASLPPTGTFASLDQGEFSLTSAFLPSDMPATGVAAEAPAHELSEGLDVQVAQGRRAFRARAMDWVTEHSVAVAHVADFFVGGADSGWHLTVDPRGEDEYQLQWKARFR